MAMESTKRRTVAEDNKDMRPSVIMERPDDNGCLGDNQDRRECCWNTFQMSNKPMHNPLGHYTRHKVSP